MNVRIAVMYFFFFFTKIIHRREEIFYFMETNKLDKFKPGVDV